MTAFPIFSSKAPEQAAYSTEAAWQLALKKHEKHTQFHLYVGPQLNTTLKAKDLFQELEIKTAVVLRHDPGSIQAAYKHLGVNALHFPIPPEKPPGSLEEMQFLADRVKKAIKTGNIFMHCEAGKGRTGTVAACLRSTFDPTVKSAEEAISLTRALIPGAIETPAQEQFVKDYFLFVNSEKAKEPKSLIKQIQEYVSSPAALPPQNAEQVLLNLEKALCLLMTSPKTSPNPMAIFFPKLDSTNPHIGKYLGNPEYAYFPANGFKDTTKLHKVVAFAFTELLENQTTRDQALETLGKVIVFYKDLKAADYPKAKEILPILYALSLAYANQLMKEAQTTQNSESQKEEILLKLTSLWDCDASSLQALVPEKMSALFSKLI
jgi:protein-tyrosine phosphatase